MPETKTRMQKFKKWVRRNSEPLIVLGSLGSIAGLTIWLSIAESKDQEKRVIAYNQWRAETNTWLNDQRNAGNSVFPLEDGRYLVVPSDAPVETVIR